VHKPDQSGVVKQTVGPTPVQNFSDMYQYTWMQRSVYRRFTMKR